MTKKPDVSAWLALGFCVGCIITQTLNDLRPRKIDIAFRGEGLESRLLIPPDDPPPPDLPSPEDDPKFVRKRLSLRIE